METPKIYVADLEAYNSGRLVGKWFDLDDYSDADELVEAIEEYMTSLGKEEYAIHDIENFPREFYSEYMNKKDFEKVYEIMEKAKEVGLPLEVVSEVAREYSIDAVDSFQGKYDDMSDFAYEIVEEMGIDSFSNPEAYMYVSETDRRIIAGEEGDNFIDNSSDREIIEEADMDFDEYQEADEEAQEKMLEEAKDIVREQIYEEWYEGLDDPYYFLVKEKGMYAPEDLKNASFVQIDYDKLGRDLGYDYNTVEYDGDVYVFSANYAKGGFLSRLFGGGKKEYNREWHQDHSQVNKAEKWERQDGMRHGKKARNRYEDGGQMSMFARGGMTKNEEIMRSFLTSKGEFEVNNLSTHYNQYDDMMLLRNYYTLIATRKGNVVKITDKKYSKSTSTIVNALVRMARDMGFDVNMVTEFAKGGTIDNLGNRVSDYDLEKLQGNGMTIKELREFFKSRFPDSFDFSLGTFKTMEDMRVLKPNPDDPFKGIENNTLKLSFDRFHSMGYRIYQGGENTYFYFLLTGSDDNAYLGQFGFKDEGDVPKEYITSFVSLLHKLYDFPFNVSHEIYGKGGKTYNRSWHQDHYNVNKDESWERQDGVRHGKTARNRYANGGEMDERDSMSYARTKGKESIDWDKELREYVGSNYSKLSQREKEEIISDMQKDFDRRHSFAKGGKLKSYKYVPNRNIESITLTQGEGTITIPQDNILDGVYIRKRYKAFGRGGDTGNYNEGLSWKLDRERFAKKQAYEVQYRKHK